MITRRLAPTVLLAGALLLAGCSSSGSDGGSGGGSSSAGASSTAPSVPSDATALVEDSFKAFDAAESVHVKGTFADAGDDGSDVGVDITYGKDVAIGTLTVSGQELGISQVADGTRYIKAGADFYRSAGAPEDTISMIADKYVVAAPDDTEGFAAFAGLLDRSAFADQLKPSGLDPAQKVTGPEDHNGVSCFVIKDSGGGFYVAAEGDPVPVEIDAGSDGVIDFDGYGDPVDVPTPSAADIVTLPAS